jgi:hypothetical protein
VQTACNGVQIRNVSALHRHCSWNPSPPQQRPSSRGEQTRPVWKQRQARAHRPSTRCRTRDNGTSTFYSGHRSSQHRIAKSSVRRLVALTRDSTAPMSIFLALSQLPLWGCSPWHGWTKPATMRKEGISERGSCASLRGMGHWDLCYFG